MESNAVKEEEVMDGIPHLNLVYESDLLDRKQHQITCNNVFNYLGLPSAPVETEMKRTSSDKLSDYIGNYEEVAKIIRKTNYVRYLDLE